MAYRALTNIKASVGDKKFRFVQGDTVEGLPVDFMKDLWNTGAIEKVDDPPAEVVGEENEDELPPAGSSELVDPAGGNPPEDPVKE